MRTKLFGAALLAVVVGGTGITASAKDHKRPNITMDRAREIALKRINGDIEEANFLDRHGRERYSIFVKEPNGLTAHELINARTGRILWVRDEVPERAKIR